MTEKQYKESITVINYLWTIGVISFDVAQEIIPQIQNYRALEIIKGMKKK